MTKKERRRVTWPTTAKRIGSAALAALVISVGTWLGGPTAAQASVVAATCTNATTDAATIQSAINGSTSGDAIVIKGPCLLNATIKLLDGRTYRGDARGTFLKQANGANLPALLASDSWINNSSTVSTSERVEQLTLDGNKTNNTGTVGLMLRTWNSRIHDVEIENMPTDGIRITNVSQNGTHLTNNSVNSIISDAFIHDNGGAGVRVADPDNRITDWVLERSWIAGSGTSAVDLDNAAGWQIRDLHIYGTQKHAINAQRCFATGIDDNYIEDFGGEGAAGTTYFGVRCTVQGDVSNVISGNNINHFLSLSAAGSFIYIGLDGVNYRTGHVSVTGNSIYGKGTARETGLSYVRSAGVGLNVVSTGNLVDNVGTARTIGSGVTVTSGQ